VEATLPFFAPPFKMFPVPILDFGEYCFSILADPYSSRRDPSTLKLKKSIKFLLFSTKLVVKKVVKFNYKTIKN
jgi:hypothetical protein